MIPERIHQFWHSEKLPAPVATSLQVLKERNPRYGATLWSQRTAGEYLERHFGPDIAGLFGCCAIPAMQSDFFRYCVLLNEGGIYLDSDAIANVAFERWVDVDADIVLAMTNIQDRDKPGLSNCLIGSAAQAPLLAFVLGQCLFNIARQSSNNIAWVTGPRTLHCALRYKRALRAQLVDPRDCYVDNFDLGQKGRPEHWSRRQQSESIFKHASPALPCDDEDALERLLEQLKGVNPGIDPPCVENIGLGWRYARFEFDLRSGDDLQPAADKLDGSGTDFDFESLASESFESHDREVKQWRQDCVRRHMAIFEDALQQLVAAALEGEALPDPVRGSPQPSSGLWQQAAVSLEAAGSARLALDCIGRALAGMEFHRGIWLAATRLYSANACYHEAEQTSLAILRGDPENTAALHYLARAYEHSGRLDQARVTAEKLLAAANSENAYLQLARIQLTQGEAKMAGATLARARELFPDSPRFDHLLQQVH